MQNILQQQAKRVAFISITKAIEDLKLEAQFIVSHYIPMHFKVELIFTS